jgi:hypothetical protein
MAKEIARHVNLHTRTVVVEVEDDFGVVSRHTIPLIGDCCSMCGHQFPGSNGTPDVEASIAQAVAHVDGIMDEMIPKLEKVAHSSPQIKEHVERAKAKKNGHRAPGQN